MHRNIALAILVVVSAVVGAFGGAAFVASSADETVHRGLSSVIGTDDAVTCPAPVPSPDDPAPEVDVRVTHPGEADSPLRYSVTAERSPETRGVTVDIPDDARNVTTTGLEPAAGEGVYTLSGEQGRVTFESGRNYSEADNQFVEDDWAYVRSPDVSVGFRSGLSTFCFSPFERGSPASVTGTNAGVEYTGTGLYVGRLMGTFESYTVTVDDRPVTVVNPGEVFLPPSSSGLSDRLRSMEPLPCGSEAPATVFLLPDESRGGGYAITPFPDHRVETAWVNADTASQNGVGDVVRHEYVHLCQGYQTDPGTSPRMEWFDEASAEYFTSLSAYQTGSATESDVYRTMTYGHPAYTDSEFDGEAPVLSDPSTDGETIQYTHGEAVLLVLDIELRAHSDGAYTVADVFRWMNERDAPVTYAAFRAHIVAHTDAETGRWLDSVVTEPNPVDQRAYTVPTDGPFDTVNGTANGTATAADGSDDTAPSDSSASD